MNAKDTVFSSNHSLNLRGKIMDLSVPRVMGILNLTPDSFYDGGSYAGIPEIMKKVDEMVRDGADIIDIGGYSSRPGADHVTPEEEAGRIFPVLEAVRKSHPDIPLSLDTFRAELAARAIRDFGIDMVNDITGGEGDKSMYKVVSENRVAYVLMHMRGTPATMQKLTDYRDIMSELIAYFAIRKEKLRSMGAVDVIIDPGFGFAKTLDQNYFILHHMADLRILEVPILAGLSRKSMIYNHLNISPDEALAGTITLNTVALLNGASILRVHDVREAVQAIALLSKTHSN
jgi:dihydropteroate synthase